MIKKKFIGEFTVSSFLHREVFTHSHKKQTWVTKKTISALIDVVKPVDDVEEGEAEGEYYP